MNYTDPKFLARSREAFLSENPGTLEDLRRLLEADDSLEATRRRDLLSALNRLKVACACDLNGVPATAAAVRKLVAKLSAVKLGASEKTLANVRSLLAQLIRHYGVSPMPLKRRIPFAPEWRELIKMVTVEYQRIALHRLAAFCTVMGIRPIDVCGDTLVGLHKALDAEEVVKNPRSILKNTISNWNRCRRTVSKWPNIILSSPFKTEPFTLRLSALSDGLREDVAKWVDLMTNPDPLDHEAPIRPLRPATIEHRVLQIRQFASALVHRGDLKVEDITSLSTLFEPKHFKSALRFFLDRQGGTTTARLHNQANALRYIAKNHCKLDEATLNALAAMTKRLDPGGGRQMTQRNRERLRQFDDARNIARLLAFPEDQLTRARKEKNPIRAAKRIECALAASLLIYCGLRMGTLRALEVTDFSWSHVRQQSLCHLNIPKEKMKGNRPLEFELPMVVAEIVRMYISEYRKRLPGEAGPFLLPGQSGGKRSRHAIGDVLRHRLLKDAGLVMHPHLFRHAIAKIVVERDPGAYLAVSRVLGHTSLDTTMAHYLGTESKAAARHVDRLLADAKAEIPVSRGKSQRARRIGK